MEINADFKQLAFEHGATMPWVASPMPGVARRMLDRIGDELARATSIVRYDPGSHFSSHVHSGGEEFLVLDGIFQDEHGDYPPGTYVRNPINTEHTPSSAPGCEIFVKLWQFGAAEKEIVRTDTNTMTLTRSTKRQGVQSGTLYSDDRETVAIEQWDNNAAISLCHAGGLELLVMEGNFKITDTGRTGQSAGGESFVKKSWLRVPKDENVTVTAGARGARIWVKYGHLDYLTVPATTSGTT